MSRNLIKRLYSTSRRLNQNSSKELITKTECMRDDIIPRIGLEVHAQLDLSSKLFSHGAYFYQAPPNSQLDFLDVSLPGVLPKLNSRAVELAIISSLGLKCSVQKSIHFDRKNYFYTDMPSGFQLTQINRPIAIDGYIDFIVSTYNRPASPSPQQYDLESYLFEERSRLEFDPYIKKSRIKQIQLEHDSAKTLDLFEDPTQLPVCDLVDYNRSGASLIEIVFEPDLTSHHEASSLVKELIAILRTLKTCKCELQEGTLRVDANVSIASICGNDVGQSHKVELKNLNSIKALNRGIHEEIQRQAKIIRAGQSVANETRTYDTRTGKTLPLRFKESSVDYRIVPDPNLPPLSLSVEFVGRLASKLTARLPSETRDMLMNSKTNLNLSLINELESDVGLSDLLLEFIGENPGCDANKVAEFLIFCKGTLKDVKCLTHPVDFHPESDFMRALRPQRIKALVTMILDGETNFSIAHEVIKYMIVSDVESSPKDIVEKMGWTLINDPDEVEKLCLELIKKMKNISRNYSKKGQKRHMFMMLDKLCELTDGKISLCVAFEILNKLLKRKNDK